MLNSSYKKKSFGELIELAKEDDFKALGEIIRLIQKDVYTTLSYLVNDKSSVADLTQNVLIKVAKNIKSLQETERFNAWLNRIISNVYYDELRKQKNVGLYISLDDESYLELKDETGSCPAEKCAATEIDKLVKKSILNLPIHLKIPIILRELAGLTYQEIANITHASLGTVKSRIARARNILQNELKNCI